MILNVQRQPGANVIETVDRVKALLPQLQAALPASIDVRVLADRTTTIRASVDDVEFELLLAIALVVMVIFLFLRSLPATIIPSVAVPLSLVGTFGVMYLVGFSINNLTLMALVISTGFVVDDAIVMIENIARYVEDGEAPLAAALKGARQIGFTIISLTVSLIAVLIPLLFMGDVVGRLFHEFAITLAVAILISAVVSLTLTPMMCARLLRHEREDEQSRLGRAVGRAFERIIALLRPGARLGARPSGGDAGRVRAHAGADRPALHVGAEGLLPGAGHRPDPGRHRGRAVDLVRRHGRTPAGAGRGDPEGSGGRSVSSFIGVDGANATLNTGRMLIALKPAGERGATAAEVARRLADAARGVPGISLYLQPVQDLTIEDRLSKTQYQFTLASPDIAELSRSTAALLDRLRRLPQLADVASDQQEQGLQAWVDIDRDAAGRLGVSVAAIDSALYSAFGQRLISTIFTQSSQYRVILEVAPQYRRGLDALNRLHVPGAGGVQVPLASVARFSERLAPLAVNHVAQFPAATISFNLAPGASLGAAVEAIKAEVAALHLPGSVETGFQGAALAFQASLSSTLLLILAAVVTMYIVLGVLYESTVHPLTILSTLPSAGLGALLALLAFGLDLDIIAVIGIVLLIGIVKKNAIMMIDFALDAQREEGLSPRQAIRQACLLRFRPILMTTMAALLGALPLMLGTGVGSELRHPLGVVMVGGLIVSQLLTLFTTPVIYLGFARLAERFGGRSATPPAGPAPHGGPLPAGLPAPAAAADATAGRSAA